MKRLHKVWNRLSGAEVTTESAVYRGNIVVRQEQQDQGGRKRLRRGLSGKKEEETKGEVIPRSRISMSDPTAVNSWEEEEEEEQWGENSIVHGVGKWVGCETNSLQTPGHPIKKNLFIALNHMQSWGLNQDTSLETSHTFSDRI